MSYIWSFSDDSKELLQQCLNTAANVPSENANKWLLRYGPKNHELLKKMDDSIIVEDSPEMENTPTPQENQENILNDVEMLADPDFDIIAKFAILQTKCNKNPKILLKLVQTLTKNAIDKLFNYVFDSKDIDNDFLKHFYEYFLPAYIKKENSRLCTDLIMKAHKLHPQHFKILLKSILKDLELQNNILNDFILMLNASGQSEFINNVCNIELSGEEFTHNLFNIYIAYKTCNKTTNIQNHIFSLLKTFSLHCTIDKNYGKLFLAFLQQEKSLKTAISEKDLEEIIEIHKSPFRRPCLAILKELNNNW